MVGGNIEGFTSVQHGYMPLHVGGGANTPGEGEGKKSDQSEMFLSVCSRDKSNSNAEAEYVE